MRVALALIVFALAPPAAADGCARDGIVTVGSPGWPAPGTYATWECGAAPGHPVARAQLDVAGLGPFPCADVPPAFVLGRPVPGTGALVCVPGTEPGGVEVESPVSADAPDRGVGACAPDGECAEASVADANAACRDLGEVALDLGAVVARASCVVRRE